MARYHFHVVDNAVSLDLTVVDLPGYDAALDKAEQLGSALLQNPKYGSDPDKWEIVVTDEEGSEVLRMPLSEIAGKNVG